MATPHQAEISNGDYKFIRDLIYNETRINLGDNKRELVTARLGKRIRLLEINSLRDYCRMLKNDPKTGELYHLIDAISTNHTFFFREINHFNYLNENILPQFAEGKLGNSQSLKTWSCACSTGEEPYSIAITLAEYLERKKPEAYWDIQCNDISTRVLDFASKAVYNEKRLKQVQADWRRKYFEKGKQRMAGYYRIRPTLRKCLNFYRQMSRIVRDLSAKSGKKVFFEVSGEDTELDRNVVEEIGDPLVHMIRNSLDHGLEDTEERAQTNKDKTGHVTLKAYHQGSSIVIELSDDGRGIDPKRIFQKAVENGIVREEDQLSNEEIYKLLFAPGFSTAAEITDISGRGVGMDVVKKNIEKLRGKIEIESELGKGSIFRILLPLTMAIVDGLVVKVGADRFILPTTSVKVALRPDAEMMTKIQGNQEVLNLRGKIIPLFRLHDHFQIENAVTDPKKATIVVVETAGRPCGLLVDDMISKQEVVIKSLGSMMQGIQGVFGGAILGDGNIALILDPASLVSAA